MALFTDCLLFHDKLFRRDSLPFLVCLGQVAAERVLGLEDPLAVWAIEGDAHCVLVGHVPARVILAHKNFATEKAEEASAIGLAEVIPCQTLKITRI